LGKLQFKTITGTKFEKPPSQPTAGKNSMVSVVQATWEPESRRIMVSGKPGQKVCKTASQEEKRWVW
jgi:hypothetical protein